MFFFVKTDVCGDPAQDQKLFRLYINKKLMFVVLTKPGIIQNDKKEYFTAIEIQMIVWTMHDEAMQHLCAHIMHTYQKTKWQYIKIDPWFLDDFPMLIRLGFDFGLDENDEYGYALAPLRTHD